MKCLILPLVFIFPVAVFTNPFPLFDNSIRFYLNPALSGKNSEIDGTSGAETFYKQKSLYGRAEIQSSGFQKLDLKYEAGTGLILTEDQSWLIGINAMAHSAGKTNPLKISAGPRIMFKDDFFSAWFQTYFNGEFFWGAVLKPAIFIPLELGIIHKRDQKDSLEFSLKAAFFKDFATRFTYDFLLNTSGLGFELNVGKQVAIDAEVGFNLSKKNENQFDLGLIFYFKEIQKQELNDGDLKSTGEKT